MKNDELINKAESVLNRKIVNGRLHGDVGAALISEKDRIYTGVCVDTSGWGLCAERSAIAAMITAGEYRVKTIVAVWREDKAIDSHGKLHVLSPCGYCRQFMRDINRFQAIFAPRDQSAGSWRIVSVRRPSRSWQSLPTRQ
jgi:cytidine deaminase